MLNLQYVSCRKCKQKVQLIIIISLDGLTGKEQSVRGLADTALYISLGLLISSQVRASVDLPLLRSVPSESGEGAVSYILFWNLDVVWIQWILGKNSLWSCNIIFYQEYPNFLAQAPHQQSKPKIILPGTSSCFSAGLSSLCLGLVDLLPW